MKDGLVAVILGKQRSFAQFSDTLGTKFCRDLVAAYQKFPVDRKASERSYWYALEGFLQYVGSSKHHSFLTESLRNESAQSEQLIAAFHSAVSGFRESLATNESISNRTKDNSVARLRACLKHFINEGLMPYGIERGLKGFKYIDKIGSGTTLLDVDEYLNETVGDELDSEEFSDLKNLLNNILLDTEHVTEEDIVDASLSTLNKRIKAIENKCAELIAEHYNEMLTAQSWLNDIAVIDASDLLHKALISDESNAWVRKKNYQKALEKSPLKVAYAYCIRYHQGSIPFHKSPYQGILRTQLKAHGIEMSYVSKLLGKYYVGLSAAIGFLCIQFSGNPTSINELKVDAVQPTAEPNVYTITWVKYRKGKSSGVETETFEHYPRATVSKDGLSPLEVINYVLLATKYIRERACSSVKEHLILSSYKEIDGTKMMDYPVANRNFKTITKLASENRWVSTLKALRGSNLLITGLALKDPWEVMRKGRHVSMESGTRYTKHIPEIMRRESNIREFLDWFETLLTINIEGFAERIGIDPESYNDRKEAINQQFGGLHCTDPFSGIQPGTEKGEVCSRVDKCVTCANRRNFFLFTKTNITNLIHWHEELGRAKDLLTDKQFKPWENWDLFTSLMLDKVASTPGHTRLLEQCEEAAKTNKNPYINLIEITEVV